MQSTVHLLDDFSLKAVINNCKELNIISIEKGHCFDTDFISYIIFFKYNNTVYCSNIGKSFLASKDFQKSLFVELVKSSVNRTIVDLDNIYSLNVNQYQKSTLLIFDFVLYQLNCHYQCELLDKHPFTFEEHIYDFIYRHTRRNTDVIDIFNLCMHKFQPKFETLQSF